MWGLLPLYLREVRAVRPLELLAHRVVWSAAVLLGIMALGLRRRAVVSALFASRSVVAGFAASAAMLSVNWLVYLWAVGVGRNVDASLGYFINPLLSVALGALVLHERLSPLRWSAVACALAGVAWLTVLTGQVPWIGLALAASFAIYSLLRKTARLGALEGLFLEILLLFPAALTYLAWLGVHGGCRFLEGATRLRVLVVMAGPVTVVPLLLFAGGARRIPLSLVGMLQYIGPTLQLVIGVLVEHEPLPPRKVGGYALVWLAFALTTADGLIAARRARAVPGRLPASSPLRRGWPSPRTPAAPGCAPPATIRNRRWS
jgi:chloramphenicol-sensitive protein RarD